MKRYAFLFLFILTIPFLYCTQVSGNTSGIWIPADNPYELVGDVTIPAGQSLTLQPGVEVHALGLYQIIAQGYITAVGTVDDSIRFISTQIEPNALWDGIRLEDTTEQSQFAYCRIDNADYGINSVNSPANITFCHFKNNRRGIQTFGIGAANPATVVIDNDLIELSIQNGIIVVQNSNTSITNNDITRNGTSTAYYGAIQLSNQSAGGSCSPTIAYNHIHHNYKQGIIAWDIVSAGAIHPEVHHNLVENNLTGIYFRQSSGALHHNTVINNFILGDANSGAGIMVSGATAQPFFAENTITGNYTGFYLTENANPCLGDLSNNYIWAVGNNTITNNIDAENVMHSVFCYSYTNANITIKAENNFWDFNTATEIGNTIQDNNDLASLPTVDFDPWQNNPVPIYLTGTITLPNPSVPTATLELISVLTGNILNTWTVSINEPFSFPVYHDTLVYIVAHMSDLIETQYYGAYGGTDNPIPAQIIGDAQYDVGEIGLSTPPPVWYYRRFGTPRMVGTHLSFPLDMGWFVYAPTAHYYLYRDGDFLILSRIEDIVDTTHVAFDVVNPPIWMIVNNIASHASWEQYTGAYVFTHEAFTETARATVGITTNEYGHASTYDLIKIGDNFEIQLYDHESNDWVEYVQYNDPFSHLITSQKVLAPVSVVPDDTLFPLAEDNYWQVIYSQPATVPTYFGYETADSLSFYWIPPGGYIVTTVYKLYDNGTLIAELPSDLQKLTIPIPYDGTEHIYTLSAYYSGAEHFNEHSITLTFTGNDDEIQPAVKLSVYPNPFDPALSGLTVKYGLSAPTQVRILVYNVKGQLVWETVPEKDASQSNWDGRAKDGKPCASGLYTLVLKDAKGKTQVRKLALIR